MSQLNDGHSQLSFTDDELKLYMLYFADMNEEFYANDTEFFSCVQAQCIVNII